MTGKNPLNVILKVVCSPIIFLIIVAAVFMSVTALFTGKKKKVRRTVNVPDPRTINEPKIMLLEIKPKVLFLEHKELGE